MNRDFQVEGKTSGAKFTLKLHRGEGMCLVAMNWKRGKPPEDFVGFAIEYQEPGGDRFYPITNRLTFPDKNGNVDSRKSSTRLSPIQKFRWVHFPRNAEMNGEFLYRVTPVFMNEQNELSYGEPQEAAIELRRETYPGPLNVTFTRGFVSSQAFVDHYSSDGEEISTLLPVKADNGLSFTPTHPKADEALKWMGFEARDAIIEVLDLALGDETAKVRVVAYDLNEKEIVDRLVRLGNRLKIIIDDEGAHDKSTSAESKAAKTLINSAGNDNVLRQRMLQLQHNKMIVVNGEKVKKVVCGSTNFSWRGFFVQNNNAMVLTGEAPVKLFEAAFDMYWTNVPAKFAASQQACWANLGLPGIDAQVTFSPHSKKNAVLQTIATDISGKTESSLLYSLAFLYQTRGCIRNAVKDVTADSSKFVYGISDRKVDDMVSGIDLQKPSGNVTPVYPAVLAKNLPEPFKKEPVGGGGTRMHHKFVVIDFDKPSARVYLGSYNFSDTADLKNGENLLLIRDRRVAVAYAIEAIRIFDHYHFRVNYEEAKNAKKSLALIRPPRKKGEVPWWAESYEDPRKIRDREIFA
jgi:hypothetical protein